MEIDPNENQELKQKAEALRSLCTGNLPSSITNLSKASRQIPSGKDFHYYFNFDEFRAPIDLITENTQGMLETVGNSTHICGKDMAYQDELADAYDWMVNVNDEVFERLDVSMDEFAAARKEEEKGSGGRVELGGGFQMVYGKKKKKGSIGGEKVLGKGFGKGKNGLKVASRDEKFGNRKQKIPFHIPTIPRPQITFHMVVNNSNEPFEHVWLPRSEDGLHFIHPLEKHSPLDFVDTESRESEEPGLMSSTPFVFVQEVNDLKELAAKLAVVDEFAVDLEHNQYRSFQGMTCLMQISTRNEDFIIDTLKLRVHVGPYLREVFKNPKKKKVMHGADCDVLWLQRDFGIYICNLFDTGQASRVLKLERNSLEYLLYHYCGVVADKEYQNADWRLRSLPHEMLRYAREDTHYLLYIYDLMRSELLKMSAGSENTDELLVEVYKRSYDICMQLYEKELLTETSYLYIYGLQGTDFNAQQLAVVHGLCRWRDFVARAEDESTGYILPNRILLEIAKHMPSNAGKLRDLVKSKHYYLESNLGAVVNVIHNSLQNTSAFEVAAKDLKNMHKERLESNGNKVSTREASTVSGTVTGGTDFPERLRTSVVSQPAMVDEFVKPEESVTQKHSCSAAHLLGEKTYVSRLGTQCLSSPIDLAESMKGAEVTVQKLDRPTCAFGAFFGGSSTKKKSEDIKNVAEVTVEKLDKPTRAFGTVFGSSSATKKKSEDMKHADGDAKLQQIKASVTLPFYSFSDAPKEIVLDDVTPSRTPGDEHAELSSPLSPAADVIPLGPCPSEDGDAKDLVEENEHAITLSNLASCFQKCAPSKHKNKAVEEGQKGRQRLDSRKFEPFDYEKARQKIRFGEGEDDGGGEMFHSDGRKSGAGHRGLKAADLSGVLPQGRRRQAFPASGNRGATFRS